MNITVVWNVWNNYEDVLLGSEIFKLENEKLSLFKELYMYAQGGYPEPPKAHEMAYLDAFFNVEIDETHPVIKQHVKFKGVFRVLNGIQKAYQVAKINGSDYAVITNADAWFLDIEKLYVILNREDVVSSAVSVRIGPGVGLYLNYGDFIPFFDDHFIILNIANCKKHKIFDYDVPRAYNANFFAYGGIHYVLIAMMDELVPEGLFNIYTYVEDGINHYAEPSGFSLLPWQYQNSTGFLHANCEQEPYLHNLRAAFLEVLGLDLYPNVKRYCQKYNKRNDVLINKEKKIVFYKKNILEKIEFLLIKINMKLKKFIVQNILHKKKIDYFFGNKKNIFSELYEDVLPISYVSRRPKKDISK